MPPRLVPAPLSLLLGGCAAPELTATEAAAHAAGSPAFSLLLRGNPEVAELGRTRLERAVGVVYRPEMERQSQYFDARLTGQFDAIVYFDRTNAVTPLR